MHYDAIVIGAGLSGLAAGIRLAHYGKKVLILEAHAVAGGLNSFYMRKGISIDVGLHAMTNFVPRGTRGAPLTKLLRQLRLDYDALDLVKQGYSATRFPGAALTFDNDPERLRASVAEAFPGQVGGFDALRQRILATDEITLDPPALTARQVVSEHLTEPLLIEMLLCPTFYYGSAMEDDMDWTIFCMLWKSVYESGFCRPRRGMRGVIDLLLNRYAEAGGEIRFGTAVQALRVREGAVAEVVLKDETLQAAQVYSCAGGVETLRLLEETPPEAGAERVGRISVAELVLILDTPPAAVGVAESIRFFSNTERFAYRRPDKPLSLASGVVCAPNNFAYDPPLEAGRLRMTALASFDHWSKLRAAEGEAYRLAKEHATEVMVEELTRQGATVAGHVTLSDLFTPLTIQRYTRHLDGAVYGSPVKDRRGRTPCANLFLIGSDQGYLGIVGALLSGITIANLYGLR